MLVTLKELLNDAKKSKKAVGAFNGTSLEAIRAIVQSAEALDMPVILQHAQSHDDIIDLQEIAPLLLHYARKAKVPIAVHLDHGSSFNRCMEAIRLGFTSVMYDASEKDFATNISETKEIVKIAHAVGVSVEAELGHMFTSTIVNGEGSVADDADSYDNLDNIYTDPSAAATFVEETEVDCLAIAFGTVHGVYVKKPQLDLERVARIRDEVGIPLVMHGGSGISDEEYRVAIANGICKINYYTYMNNAGGQALLEAMNKDPERLFFDKLTLLATEAMQQDVMRAMRVFGGK